MQFRELFNWIVSAAFAFSSWNYCASVHSGSVYLTVEGGVSLVGPHCPGTVRLFCEGVDLTSLGWIYNARILIADRVATDHRVTDPVYPNNPAFVSVHITNVSSDSLSRANFSSILIVDLLELNKQNVKNISCGDLSDEDTLQVDITDYFNPNVTASYQSGVLNRIEVQLFPTGNEFYDLMIVASNHSSILKESRLTVSQYSSYYFIWTVNSTSCQRYSVQCTAGVVVPDSSLCSITHTDNFGASTTSSIPLNTLSQLPYISQPDTIYYFEFSAVVKDYLLIRESIRRTEPPAIELKAIFILTITSLFLLIALVHLLSIFLCAICRTAILAYKKTAHVLSTVMLLVLVFTCAALLLAFGAIVNDICNSDESLQNTVLNIMIGVACLGIITVVLTWILMAYGFYKHRGKRSNEEDHYTLPTITKATRNIAHLFSNCCHSSESTCKKTLYSPTDEQANIQPTVLDGPEYEDMSQAPEEETELVTNTKKEIELRAYYAYVPTNQTHGPILRPEEDIELKSNQAYGPVPKSREETELKANQAYGLVSKPNEGIGLKTNQAYGPVPKPKEEIELKTNQAYGPVPKPKEEIELKTNQAYGPVPKPKEEIELKTNQAYGPVPKPKEEIELKTNQAYGPVPKPKEDIEFQTKRED